MKNFKVIPDPDYRKLFRIECLSEEADGLIGRYTPFQSEDKKVLKAWIEHLDGLIGIGAKLRCSNCCLYHVGEMCGLDIVTSKGGEGICVGFRRTTPNHSCYYFVERPEGMEMPYSSYEARQFYVKYREVIADLGINLSDELLNGKDGVKTAESIRATNQMIQDMLEMGKDSMFHGEKHLLPLCGLEHHPNLNCKKK